MKKTLLILCALLALSFTQSSTVHDSGKVIESLSIQSKLLKRGVNYSVYLPPGYDESERHYPVVYLLHGYSDNETSWIQFGEINRYADNAINDGIIPPMVIVMPDAELTWYVNDFDGKVPYEDFFIQEFMPFVEKTYRIRAKKEFRGIAGLSMGGYGALLYGLKHPDLFASAAPLSAAITTESDVENFSQQRWDEVEGPMYGKGLVGKDRITEHWKNNNPFYIVDHTSPDSIKKVRFYFDCGDEDSLFAENAKMHINFLNWRVPHEFRVRDGSHSWTYWRTGITDALKFIGDGFHR